MKYVYVLTSSESDFYYEQFYISVTSLRLHNQRANIVVIVDSKTKEGLTGKRSGFKQHVSEIVTITVPQELSQKEASRWIKTSINKHISGDFIFIDCDTVITGKLDPGFSPKVNVGAVLDNHVSLSNHHLALYFEERRKKSGFNFSETGQYFNSGVIFYRDTAQSNDFFSLWHSLWLTASKKGIHQDQPALNQANHEMGGVLTELSGEWNCQITHNGLPFLSNAKIIHCYATSMKLYNCPFLPASLPVLSSVKETGAISEELMEMLKDPKAAFEPYSRIISGETELDAINSKLFSLLLFIRKRMPGLFKKTNSFILKTRAKTQK